MLVAGPVMAEQMTVLFMDETGQDWLPPPMGAGVYWVHELGNQPAFPASEWITSSDWETDYRPCSENPDDPGIANIVVSITNMTGAAWPTLYYVADPETSLANDDGTVNGEPAFKIDSIGVNTPLIFESMTSDNVFEVGETWQFVIQDYVNSLGLAPSLFGGVGVGGGLAPSPGYYPGSPGSGGDFASSGSIIPEPTTLGLLIFGGVALLRRRRG